MTANRPGHRTQCALLAREAATEDPKQLVQYRQRLCHLDAYNCRASTCNGHPITYKPGLRRVGTNAR